MRFNRNVSREVAKAAKLWVLLCLWALPALPALAQPHIVGISPPFVDPPFPTVVYVFAEQLANKSVTIEGAPAHNFQDAYALAFYACYSERQTVVATAPVGGGFSFQFFRARNDPCNGFAPGTQELLDSELYTATSDGRLWRLYEINGSNGKRYVAKAFLQL